MRSLIACAALVAAAIAPARALGASWAAPIPVPASGGGITSDVALASDGTVAVAWASGRVVLRRAGHWLPVHRFGGSLHSTTAPDIAFTSRNELLATWVQASSRPGRPLKGPYQVRVVRWTRNTGWGNVRVLGRSGHFSVAAPRIAVDPRGDALVSWRGFARVGDGSVREVVATSFRPAGGNFGAEQHLPDGGPYQDLALDEQGNAYAVWTTFGGPVNRFSYHPRGKSWWPPQTFTAPPASNPSIAVTPDHRAVIAWRAAPVDSEGAGTQYGTVYAVVRAASGRFSQPVKISDVRVHDVAASVAPDGEVMLSWGPPEALVEPPVPGAADLRFTTFDAGVMPSLAGGMPSEHRVAGLRWGPLAYLADNSALLVYAASGSVHAVTYTRALDAFGDPVRIASHGLYPSLAVSGLRAAAVWFDPVRRRLALAVRSA